MRGSFFVVVFLLAVFPAAAQTENPQFSDSQDVVVTLTGSDGGAESSITPFRVRGL